MKAIILCGGKGTRLRPLTATTPKQLLPVVNKPILYYVMEQIVAAGITGIGLIISPETGEHIKKSIGDGSPWGAEVSYIVQDQPQGLAHAVLVSRDYLGSDDFLMFLGDNLIEGGVTRFVERFKLEMPSALILLKKVEDARPFGVAELDKSGRVIGVVEKPQKPKSDLIVTGVYLFNSRIFKAISQISPSWRGELEITDSIQKLIDMKETVNSYILDGWWLDTGKKEDLIAANSIMLESILKHSVKGQVNINSTITGIVEIAEGTTINNSTINGPVAIAPNCSINGSTIGPFTCIGANVSLDSVAVNRSIIMEGCKITGFSTIDNSIIGNNCILGASGADEHNKTLLLGDDAEVIL